MATFHIPITCLDTTGATNFKVSYRHAGTSVWTSYLIPASSGTTTSFTGTNNWIYDIQVQNLNGTDNALSAISQAIGITAPDLTINPTDITVAYSFDNLSDDMDTYTVTIATTAEPGVILATHILSAGVYPNTITDSFTDLLSFTSYVLNVTPAANEFTDTFSYTFNTTEGVTCVAPLDATATIS